MTFFHFFTALNYLSSLSLKSTSPPAPWLSEVLQSNQRELRTAKKRWRKTFQNSELIFYCSLLSNLWHELTFAKSSFFRTNFEEPASNPCKLLTPFHPLSNPLLYLLLQISQQKTLQSSLTRRSAVLWDPFLQKTSCLLHSLMPSYCSPLRTCHYFWSPANHPIKRTPDDSNRPHPTHCLHNQRLLDDCHVPFAFKCAVVTRILKKIILRCQQLQTPFLLPFQSLGTYSV